MSMSSAMSMSNKRSFGLMGIDHTGESSRVRQRRQIGATDTTQSAGRHGPIHSQASVAQTVIMAMPPQSTQFENKPSELMAPRGDDFKAMIPKRGEWCVRIDLQNRSHTSAAYSIARVNDTQVYTCGNGVSKDENLIFMGIVTNGEDLLDPDRDNVGAIDIAGTVTGINYGPERLSAGDYVYIGLPFMIDINMNDSITSVPAVSCSGMPASKAHFGTYRLKWNNVSSAIADIVGFVDEEYIKHPHAGFTQEANLRSLFEISRGLRDEMPLTRYATIYAHQVRCNSVLDSVSGSKSTAPEMAAALNGFVGYMRLFDLHLVKIANTYDKSIGLESIDEDNEIHNKAKYDAAVSISREAANALFVKLLIFADRYKAYSIDMAHNFIRQRIMGKVLVNSDPGQQLDVLLGYGG